MEYALPLIGLALIDSLSVGTLVVPIGLLLVWRKLHVKAYFTYLCTVAIAYFALGIALMTGLRLALNALHGVGEQKWFHWLLFIAGLGLAAYGILSPNPKKEDPESSASDKKGRLRRAPTTLAMISLGLAVTLAEAATMVPYLAAISLMEAATGATAGRVGLLATYCVIMILPAVLIGALVLWRSEKIMPILNRFAVRMEYEARVTLLWLAALIGIYLAASNAVKLGLIAA